jgi:hypothetical protein
MDMKSILKLTFTFSVILFLCSANGEPELTEITVNRDKESPLPLSKITEKVEAIELEVTDQSLISRVNRVLCSDKYIIVVCGQKSIMLFDKSGKFIRQIGSAGPGPEEYTRIVDITSDNKKGHVYVSASDGKILCYDFEGNFIRKSLSGFGGNYINYVHDRLLVIVEKAITEGRERMSRSCVYMMDDNLSKTDSVEIRRIVLNGVWMHPYNDFITDDGENLYLYYSDISTNPVVYDTLYQLKNKRLIPSLNLKFKNKGMKINGDKDIYLMNIYKSSRYVFAVYKEDVNNQFYYFCHDMKDGESHNMKDGYTDDIHTGEKVKIRPFDSDANRFYYLHTNMGDSDMEEPNPTLYIGTLKK